MEVIVLCELKHFLFAFSASCYFEESLQNMSKEKSDGKVGEDGGSDVQTDGSQGFIFILTIFCWDVIIKFKYL